MRRCLAAMDTALTDRETRLTIDFIGISGIMWMVLIAGAYSRSRSPISSVSSARSCSS